MVPFDNFFFPINKEDTVKYACFAQQYVNIGNIGLE